MSSVRHRLMLALICLTTAAQAAPKKPLCGLVTMGAVHFQRTGEDPDNSLREANAHPGIYVAAAILAKWSQLQPEPGVLNTAVIDQGLNAVRAYNRAHPATPLVAKLRVFSGPSAPQWVKALGGGPLMVMLHKQPAQIAPFWTTGYRGAWVKLQQMLAARYDADPLVGEVAASSCATATAEPFIFTDEPGNARSAGFSDSAFKGCLLGVAEDYAAWRDTPVDYTFGVFHDTDGGRPVHDPEFTVQAMRTWRARMGARGVLATHGLRAPLPPGLEPLYDAMRELGPPIEFQTLEPGIDQDAAVRLGLTYRPTEIEMWDSADAGGRAQVSAAMLQSWKAGFTTCGAN